MQCVMTGAVEKRFTDAISRGTATYERLKAHQGSAGNLADFLGFIHEVSWKFDTLRRIDELRSHAGKVLDWTGHKSVAVAVYIRTSGDSSAIAGIFPIGSGNCVQDVLLENFAKQYTLPLMNLPEGWSIDYGRSYYVSLERDTAGAIIPHTVLPGSMEPYRTWVPLQDEAARALRVTAYARRVDQLLNLAKQAARAEQDSVRRKQLAEVSREIADLNKRRLEVANRLKKALDAEKAAQRANAWIGRLKDGMLLYTVAQQVQVALADTAPKSVLDEVSAADAARLPQVVNHYQATTVQEKTVHQGEYDILSRDIRTKEVFVLDRAKEQGAPPEAFDLPKPP